MRRRAWPMLLLVPALMGVSCVLHGPRDLRHELSHSAGVKLQQEFGITLGRMSMWLARTGLRIAGEEEISLKGVRRFQVGVYQVTDLRRGRDERARLTLSDMPLGWEPIVRVHEDGEDVFVMTRLEDEKIRGMLVVVAEDDEWVLVRIRGNLDHVIESAMRMAFEESDRPDLYRRARRERGLDPIEETLDEADEYSPPCLRQWG